jgi:hypothetical protein
LLNRDQIVYWSALQRRLCRIDKKLQTRPEDRRPSEWILRKCPEILITGRRTKPPLQESTPGPSRLAFDDEIIILDTPVKLSQVNNSLSLSPRPSMIHSSASPLTSVRVDRPSTSILETVPPDIPTTSSTERRGKEKPDGKPGGKSVWVGRAEDVGVEQFALEYYETLGYKG